MRITGEGKGGGKGRESPDITELSSAPSRGGVWEGRRGVREEAARRIAKISASKGVRANGSFFTASSNSESLRGVLGGNGGRASDDDVDITMWARFMDGGVLSVFANIILLFFVPQG